MYAKICTLPRAVVFCEGHKDIFNVVVCINMYIFFPKFFPAQICKWRRRANGPLNHNKVVARELSTRPFVCLELVNETLITISLFFKFFRGEISLVSARTGVVYFQIGLSSSNFGESISREYS